MDHPNILKITDTYQNEHSVFIVTDICHGGDLTEIGSVIQDEEILVKVIGQILSALF